MFLYFFTMQVVKILGLKRWTGTFRILFDEGGPQLLLRPAQISEMKNNKRVEAIVSRTELNSDHSRREKGPGRGTRITVRIARGTGA